MSTITDDCKPLSAGAVGLGMPSSFAVVFPKKTWYLPIKLTAEWLGALILVVVTAPVGLLIAFLVKISSPGPVFYAQTRLGLNSSVFRMFKFRTMVQNAESGTGPIWASKDDCRITAVGRILRMTHLDELPQLWNVLRGEMSLIGPRPERPEMAARIARQIPDFRQRLALRPGITGLAQMLLPADDPADIQLHCVRRKLMHDVFYIRHLSFVMDLRIALGTPCYFVSVAISAIQQRLVRCYQLHERACIVPANLENRDQQSPVPASAERQYAKELTN